MIFCSGQAAVLFILLLLYYNSNAKRTSPLHWMNQTTSLDSESHNSSKSKHVLTKPAVKKPEIAITAGKSTSEPLILEDESIWPQTQTTNDESNSKQSTFSNGKSITPITTLEQTEITKTNKRKAYHTAKSKIIMTDDQENPTTIKESKMKATTSAQSDKQKQKKSPLSKQVPLKMRVQMKTDAMIKNITNSFWQTTTPKEFIKDKNDVSILDPEVDNSRLVEIDSDKIHFSQKPRVVSDILQSRTAITDSHNFSKSMKQATKKINTSKHSTFLHNKISSPSSTAGKKTKVVQTKWESTPSLTEETTLGNNDEESTLNLESLAEEWTLTANQDATPWELTTSVADKSIATNKLHGVLLTKKNSNSFIFSKNTQTTRPEKHKLWTNKLFTTAFSHLEKNEEITPIENEEISKEDVPESLKTTKFVPKHQRTQTLQPKMKWTTAIKIGKTANDASDLSIPDGLESEVSSERDSSEMTLPVTMQPKLLSSTFINDLSTTENNIMITPKSDDWVPVIVPPRNDNSQIHQSNLPPQTVTQMEKSFNQWSISWRSTQEPQKTFSPATVRIATRTDTTVAGNEENETKIKGASLLQQILASPKQASMLTNGQNNPIQKSNSDISKNPINKWVPSQEISEVVMAQPSNVQINKQNSQILSLELINQGFKETELQSKPEGPSGRAMIPQPINLPQRSNAKMTSWLSNIVTQESQLPNMASWTILTKKPVLFSQKLMPQLLSKPDIGSFSKISLASKIWSSVTTLPPRLLEPSERKFQ